MSNLLRSEGQELIALLKVAVERLPPVSATGDDAPSDTPPTWPESAGRSQVAVYHVEVVRGADAVG